MIVIACSLPVARSLALTFTMPFASMSNATSICGTPRGAGAIPIRWNRPSDFTPGDMTVSASPCSTLISTVFWLSSAVVKISDLRVGIVVLRSISLVKMPPFVSTPSDSGVTSSNRMSFTSPFSTPACTAAPTATTSSGFTPLCGSLPPVSFLTSSWIIGIRVEPPTRITLSIAAGVLAPVLDRLLERRLAPLDQVLGHPLELGARELHLQVQRAVGRRRDERQVDRRLGDLRQLDLGLLGGFLQPLHGHAVVRQVDAVVVLERLHQPVHDPLVPVVAAEVRVAVRGLHLEDARRRSRAARRRTCRLRGRTPGSCDPCPACPVRRRAPRRSAR